MTTGFPIPLCLAASAAIDGSFAAVVLLRRRPGDWTEPPEIGPTRVAAASMAMAASFLIKLPGWRRLGLDVFGAMHLAYADLVLLLPALGMLLWLAAIPIAGRRPWVRMSRTARLTATAAMMLAPVGVYASWVEPFRLQIESARLKVSELRAGRSSVRIGVMTDIQTDRVTDHERRAVATMMAQRPDVILIAGDVFQGTTAEFEATRNDLCDLLAGLSAPGGVYLVLGDVDGDGAHLRPLLDGTDIRLLVNEVVETRVGDCRMTIGGIELNYASAAARALVDRLEMSPGDDDIRIVLGHRPDVVLGMRPNSRIDLVVAGHTHGGQVVIPGFGPPMTLTSVPREVAAGGLHTLEGDAIYVGRGIGHERGQAPRLRFLCPPEVAVVEIAREH